MDKRYEFFNTESGWRLSGTGSARNPVARGLGILIEAKGTEHATLSAGWHLVQCWEGGDCLWRDDGPEAAFLAVHLPPTG